MYRCPRCEYLCDNSGMLTRHLNKKNMCQGNDVVDIDIEKCKTNNKYVCEFCNENFIQKSSLNRHIKFRCKERLKIMIDTLTKQINNNKGNKDLKSFNSSTIDILSDDELYECLRSCALSVPNIVQKIHFNNKYPENHNIYITNLKSGYIVVYTGKQWEIKNRDEIITDIIYKYEYKLEDWCSNEEIQIKFPKALKHLKDYNKLRDKNDNNLLENIKNEIKLILYNKKDIPIQTRKLYEN